AMPQPYLVPVRPAKSRKAHRRGVSGSTSSDTVLPFTLREIMAVSLLKLGRPARHAGDQPIARGRVPWTIGASETLPGYVDVTARQHGATPSAHLSGGGRAVGDRRPLENPHHLPPLRR